MAHLVSLVGGRYFGIGFTTTLGAIAMSTTLTVSIGRNVGDTPLRDYPWLTFCQSVKDSVALWATVVFEGLGQGTWTTEDGERITEGAYTLVSTVETLECIGALRWSLSKLAAAYGQESIALTVGTTDLVAAAGGEPF